MRWRRWTGPDMVSVSFLEPNYCDRNQLTDVTLRVEPSKSRLEESNPGGERNQKSEWVALKCSETYWAD